MRSSEHSAHRLLMHSGRTSHLWLKVSPCVSFHVIHACALVCCSLSVSPHPSFYFLVLFLFQLYLMSNSAPDEFSIEDPLCNSSLGSMVTLDYVTPLTPSGSCGGRLRSGPCARTAARVATTSAGVVVFAARRRVVVVVVVVVGDKVCMSNPLLRLIGKGALDDEGSKKGDPRPRGRSPRRKTQPPSSPLSTDNGGNIHCY